jgi:hypothetical protein
MKDALMDMLDAVLLLLQNVGATSNSLKFTHDEVALASNIFQYFSWMGICFSLVYFLIEINRKYAFEANDLTLKSMFSPFLKLLASIAILSQGAKILSWILGWNNRLIQTVAYSADFVVTASESSISDVFDINVFVSGLSFLYLFVMIIVCEVIWFVSLLVRLVWIYKAYLYKIEFLYRIGITPFALSDVYSGHNANAIRWIKGFFALTLYGISMILVPRLGNLIAFNQLFSFDATANPFERSAFLIMYLIAPIAELGVLSAIKQMTKEALG